MEYLIKKYSEGPYIGFWSIDILDKALRSHVDGTSNIDILPLFPKLTFIYMVLLAKPKSAILATPFL